jgi:general secretion pathway protein G
MLRDLIVNGYVGSIPADPMTGKNSTWRVVMEDPAKSADRKEPGIFDVHSGSDAISSDGTRYADW